MGFSKCLIGFVVAIALTACGGGGGSPGTTGSGIGSGQTPVTTAPTNTSGDSQANSAGSISIDVVNGAGVSSNSISAVEIAQATITLKDSRGAAVKGVVVTFAESVSNLLTVAPASKTALTDDLGQASVEIRAISSASTGATQIGASASVSGQTVSAQKAIAISSAPATGTVVSPQELAAAINFLDVNPADKSIVIQGSGGSGRSESATLRFRVVDKNNTPVKGVVVNFEANPNTDVTLNIVSATTDAEGVAVTTVSSKTIATSLVVKATVNGKTISSQSDQLLVTTGVGIQAGFEIGAEKYNLDGGLSGDSTNVTARIVDINGNPVADGVPVVFTTSGGRIGTSAKGGCTTINGKCSVVFEVQDPRNDDLALVTGSTKVGATQTLSGSFQINMSDPRLFFVNNALAPITAVTLSACKQSVSGLIANFRGRAAAAGTTVTANPVTTGFNAAVKLGSPLADSLLPGFGPLGVLLEFDASAMPSPYDCIPGGFTTINAEALVEMTTPASKAKSPQRVIVSYPGGRVFLADPVTEQTKSELTLSSCNAEPQTFRILTNVPGVTPPIGMTVAAANSSGALTVIASGSPVTTSPADVVVSITAPSGGPERCLSGGTGIAQFPMSLVIRLNPGQPNQITQIQTVTVKYAKAG